MSIYSILPSKHETLAQRWFTVGPQVNQRCPNVSCLLGYVQYLLHMYNFAIPYRPIEACVAIYQVENRFIRISNISATAFDHLHFSDPVVEISDRHVENVIFLGKTNTAIHGPRINSMGSSFVIIILTIRWKITT